DPGRDRPGVRTSPGAGAGGRRHPPARRRDHGRQPPLGARHRARGRRPRAPPRCGQDRRPARLVRRRRRLRRHPVHALHRQPQPAGAGAAGAPADHRGRRRRPVAPGSSLAGPGHGGARGAPARDRRRPQAGGGGHPRPAGRDGQPRRRLRRTAGDRRRGPVAAGRARRARHLTGRAGAGAGGGAHRRAPLHARPARSGPRDPHQWRAAAVGLPALADGEHGVPLHRRLLARFPAGGLPAGVARLLGPAPPVRQL
ncbi:MAG: (2E,6Z)-farnesyl diphosphate synthase, partial [uncultured Pseudonocardia sp.]